MQRKITIDIFVEVTAGVYLKGIGMPISLPMAWGLSAVIIGRIAKNWED